MKASTAALVAIALLTLTVSAVAVPARATDAVLSADDPAARAAVAALPRATAAMDADGNKLFDDLDARFRASAPGALLPVQVVFVAGTTSADGVAEVQRVAPGAHVDRSFHIIPAMAGAMSLTDALAVAALDRVRQVELDGVVHPTLDTASAAFGVTAIREQAGLTASLDGSTDMATTDDVVIAVLDSGIDTGHVDLEGKLVDWADVANGHPTPRDDTGHGTHVASIAAGWGRGSAAHTGVAPGAAIMAVKIALDNERNSGGTSDSVITAGLEYVLDNAAEHNVRVATMSYGFRTTGPNGPGDGTDANSLAIDALWDAGIVVHVSAGNGGPEAASLTRQATARGAIAVGSVLDPFGAEDAPQVNTNARDLVHRGGFSLSDFSSRGPTSDGRVKPDLLGPGDYITAALAGSRDGYVNLSGTSMSTPFVAGVSALLIAADPTLTPDEVREVLHRTAEDFGEAGPDPEYGHGRVSPVDALGAIAPDLAIEAPPVPRHTARVVTLDGPGGSATLEVQVDDFTHPLVVTSVATSGRNYDGGESTLDTILDTVEGFRPYGLISTVVFDPESTVVGDALGTASLNGLEIPWSGPRQHTVTVLGGVSGVYTVQLTGTPDERVVVDVSHSTTGP